MPVEKAGLLIAARGGVLSRGVMIVAKVERDWLHRLRLTEGLKLLTAQFGKTLPAESAAPRLSGDRRSGLQLAGYPVGDVLINVSHRLRSLLAGCSRCCNPALVASRPGSKGKEAPNAERRGSARGTLSLTRCWRES
jgi:hypothetical protein